MQLEMFVPEVLTILYLTIELFQAFAPEYLNDSSLCHAFTVPAETI